MNNKKKCFVIMPISGTKSCTQDEWTGIFEHMIKPAVTGSRLAYDCERAKPLTGAFVRDILDKLNRADVVIADLTDRNPNVCYELGIRHTLRNRTILVAQNIKDVPSDLQSYWVVTYEKDLSGAKKFKTRVREVLREMQKDPDKPDSPVADFQTLRNIDVLAYEKAANLKKLGALISELSYNIATVDSILNLVKNNEQARNEGKGSPSVSNERFSNACFELLLSTSYITFPPDWLKAIKGTDDSIKLLNTILEAWTNKAFAESVEERLKERLPGYKDILIEFTRIIATIRTEYANNNYQEPEAPLILLASPEHEEYLKLTE